MRSAAGSVRTRAKVGAVSALAAVLVLSAVGPAHSQEAPTGEGTSTLSVVPAVLDVSGLPVDVAATLGTLIADATNVGDPVARLALTDLAAAGQTAPGFAVSSADGNQSGGADRQAGAGGVGASLGLVDYLVESDADQAVADLSALAAELTTPSASASTSAPRASVPWRTRPRPSARCSSPSPASSSASVTSFRPTSSPSFRSAWSSTCSTPSVSSSHRPRRPDRRRRSAARGPRRRPRRRRSAPR